MIDGVGGGKKSGEKFFLTWQKIGKRGDKLKKMVKNVLVKNITFLERQLNKSIKEVVYPGDNGIDNKPGK